MRKAIVLCVDDDLDRLTECQTLLRNQGYHALITTSGRQSLELLATLPIDAVILHLQDPVVNWELLATKMKKLKPRIPLLLLSPRDRFPQRTRSVDAFLPETESPDKLLEAVHGLVNKRSPFFSAWFSDWKRRSAA